MYKKITMALAIAAILTAYTATLVMSNQAFAAQSNGILQGQQHFFRPLPGNLLHTQDAKLGKTLANAGLGCNPWDPC
jgi:hypothetical protein